MIDDLVRRLISLQEKEAPDDDPGDLNIQWQDDSMLVTVTQDGHFEVGIGRSAEGALRDYARQIRFEL